MNRTVQVLSIASALWALMTFLDGVARVEEGWARGYGQTLKEAVTNSLTAANEAVFVRGRGCVGNVASGTRLRPKEHDHYVVETAYLQETATCGSIGDANSWIDEQVSNLANATPVR